MNKELLENATAAILGEGYVPPELAREHAEAVLRVAIEACAEIAERDSVLDWAGGSTGNAVGTRIKIHKQIRALLADEPAK